MSLTTPPERIVMGIGDEAILKQADEVALIYGLENFMCPQCRFWRHLNQYRFSKLVAPKSSVVASLIKSARA